MGNANYEVDPVSYKGSRLEVIFAFLKQIIDSSSYMEMSGNPCSLEHYHPPTPPKITSLLLLENLAMIVITMWSLGESL